MCADIKSTMPLPHLEWYGVAQWLAPICKATLPETLSPSVIHVVLELGTYRNWDQDDGG